MHSSLNVKTKKIFYQNDMMNDGNVRNRPVRDPSCDDKLGWFKCHGSKTAKCCSKGCLNQGEGEYKPLCDQCNCNGRCDYLHDIAYAYEKNAQLRCDLEAEVEEVEEVEEPEYEEEE